MLSKKRDSSIIKTVSTLQKEEKDLNQMREERLNGTSIERMTSVHVGNEHMWTKKTMCQEIIDSRSEFGTSNDQHKQWFKDFLQRKFGEGNTSDTKLEEAVVNSRKEKTSYWWATVLKEVLEKFGPSKKLKQYSKSSNGVEFVDTWNYKINDSEPSNLLHHPFNKNNVLSTTNLEGEHEVVDFDFSTEGIGTQVPSTDDGDDNMMLEIDMLSTSVDLFNDMINMENDMDN